MVTQKEREAFEVWLRRHIKANPDLWDMEEYEKDSMFDAWQAAKAQAVPEGFVLVSKDIPDAVVKVLENSSYHWGENTRNYFAPIYSIMIEAQEKAVV